MKLHCHPISPYARKAMILCRLKGIKVEEILASADGANGYTGGVNPLGKIPALEVSKTQLLFDSPVICEYLDSLKDPLLPPSGVRRFRQLQLHALGDGLSDAVYNYRYEIVRPEYLHWSDIIERHNTAMGTSLDYLEAMVSKLGKPWGFGNIAIICALDYMHYRASHIEWQKRAPQLADWHARFTSELAYQDTYAY